MMESGMGGTGIDQVAQPQLTDSAQALKPGMLNQLEKQCMLDTDETVNRVVDNFLGSTDFGTHS